MNENEKSKELARLETEFRHMVNVRGILDKMNPKPDFWFWVVVVGSVAVLGGLYLWTK